MVSACNAQFTEEFEAALNNSLQHFRHISGLKHEQKLCLETVAQKGDIFGILATGFGKSLIFELLPHLLKDLWKLDQACVLVETPLVSIMKDQVEELICLGLRAFTRSACKMGLTGPRDSYGSCHLYICRFLFSLSTFLPLHSYSCRAFRIML